MAGYVFFAKSDTDEVVALKDRLRSLEAEQHSSHQEKIQRACVVIDKIIFHLQNKKHCADEDFSCHAELIRCISHLETLLDQEINPDPLANGG